MLFGNQIEDFVFIIDVSRINSWIIFIFGLKKEVERKKEASTNF